jgi:hypothetical protein
MGHKGTYNKSSGIFGRIWSLATYLLLAGTLRPPHMGMGWYCGDGLLAERIIYIRLHCVARNKVYSRIGFNG